MIDRSFIIVVAAGSGRRFGSAIPKQYCLLNGCPVLIHTIETLHRTLPDAKIILVLHPDYREYWQQLCNEHDCSVPAIIVDGGDTRSQSVRNALKHIPADTHTAVYVHDGARPLADEAVISPLANAIAEGCLAVIPVVAVTDSLRMLTNNEAQPSTPVNRSNFAAVQTPQAFRADILAKAYSIADAATDDASLVQEVMPDVPVKLTKGAPYNIKITSPTDIAVAEALISVRCK